MKETLLVLDSSYLCHRAFHTLRLSWDGEATGVVFGFLKGIRELKEEFNTDKIAFCFEGHPLKRLNLCPNYKNGRDRRERTPEEKKARAGLTSQIERLRTEYLPRIGFRNIFHFPGYESDDIMAQIAYSSPFKVVLVTADSDMFQCLRENVVVYSPQKQKIHTVHWFDQKYGIAPSLWPVVKALAGCHSDNVRGVPGIGEITALKFCRRELPTASKAFRMILFPESKAIVRLNRQLVELPFEGCPVPEIVEDRLSRAGWKEVCEKLGMKSIAGRIPAVNPNLCH